MSELSTSSPARSQLADRYASALFDLAKQDYALDAVQADLRGLADAISGNGELKRAIDSPAISAGEKAGVLDGLAVAANVSPVVRKLLGVMAANRRARDLLAVIAAFDALVTKDKGIVTAHVASAVALDDGQMAQLASSLQSVVGASVELSSEVKPDLLGGMVVQVGSRLYDSSLKTQIDTLKSAMKGA